MCREFYSIRHFDIPGAPICWRKNIAMRKINKPDPPFGLFLTHSSLSSKNLPTVPGWVRYLEKRAFLV